MEISQSLKKGKYDIRSIPNNIMVLFALILLSVVLSVVSPVFLTQSNLINVILQSSINATVAFGMTFVILTGGIDLSVGSIVAVAGVMLGMALQKGVSLQLALLICCISGAIFGLINGLLITEAKLPPFIGTLGTMSIGRGLALFITGGRSISGFSNDFIFIGNGKFFGVPLLVIIMVVTFSVSAFILRYTRAGRYFYAIGGNREATRLTGINVKKYITIVYAISGLTAGIAAVMLSARLNSAQPIAGDKYEMDAIAATVIGGTSLQGGEGSISGTIIGALIIAVLRNGLNLLSVSSYIQQIVIGLVIIFAVMLDTVRNNR